ncbi:MAG: L,D-transpeptidase family protein [Chitinophagaceae bacterium]|nr:L,D-transpeptidase family protein [Chitinophagaceae bacterium]
MSKKNWLFGAVLLIIFSCNSKKDKEEQTEQPEIENVDAPEEKTGKAKKVTDRDYSIDENTAYNNVFLDSMAMERYIETRQLSDKKIARRIRSFYNARNYQYAWFAPSGLTEQARFFWNQYDYAVTHLKDSSLLNSGFYKKADGYMSQEKVVFSSKDSGMLQTEFGFTEHFIRYINSTYEKGYVKRKEQEKFIPIKKMYPMIMADSLLNKKHKDEKYYEDVNPMYAALKKQLGVYFEIARLGGWPEIPVIKGSLKKEASDPAIPLVKKRLQLTGDMPGKDSSAIFTDTLELAVKKFQHSLGYKQTGILSAGLIKDMNVSADKRVQQILINMDRMRWMPQQPKGNLIIVNIPEFILHVYDGNQSVFDMVVVVGKVGNNTMMFNGDLSYLVFSPYWNVPQSIIKNEILPAIARNPGYLDRKNMEKYGNGIRQRPGPGNALGKVKFIFPNSFNMYFHDTPSKGFFNEDKRAFSHGCIRLSEPQKMAEWLLRNETEWTREKIVAAMNRTSEQMVKLKQPVPVFIIYYTAWVDNDGNLQFRDDVYKHDAELAGKMFDQRPATTVVKVDNMKVPGKE